MSEQVKAIALALRDMRNAAGLSQAQVGERMFASAQSGQAQLAKWEAWAAGKKSGKEPSLENLIKWAQVFNLDVEVKMSLIPRATAL